MIDFAVNLAYRAGALVRAGMANERTVEAKGRADLVTDIDRASEQLIVSAIRAAFPDHAIMAEEGSGDARAGTFTWLVDPLDGTTNYAHGYPVSSVSIALVHNGQPALGVVYDPWRDELFTAERGGGAFCNGRRLRVSATPNLAVALLSTGFPYDRFERPDNNLAEFARLVLRIQGVRRSGSAALDLCYVAAGRSDGHWELGLHAWDVAAGALLVTEAGGRLSDWQGRPWQVDNDRLAATNGVIHTELIDVLNDGLLHA